MPRTVERPLQSIVSFECNKPKSSSPSLINLPAETVSPNQVHPSVSTPFVVTPYLNPVVYEPVSPVQRITEHYKQYVATAVNHQSNLVAKNPDDMLANIKLQMMYVVDSQRGSPALFVVKGWLTGDNSKWFDCIARNDPSIPNTIDFTKNGYQEIPQFDTVLKAYNELVDRYPHETNSAIVSEGRRKHWNPPTEMRWTMVGIENHTLVVWVGPHRVISQPGHTTHIYIHPKPRDALIDEMNTQPQLRTMMETIRLRLGATSSEHALFPLPTDQPSCGTDYNPTEQENARNAIGALRERSWAAIHYKRDSTLSRQFFQKEENPVNTYFTKARAVATCCAKVQPTVFAIWQQLYKGISEHSSHYVSFPPTEYTQYRDDDSSPFFPPHIDYRAVF